MSDHNAALVRMVDQISHNFAYLPVEEAGLRIANHLRMFWSPAMRSQLLDYVDAGGAGLTPQALRAVTELRTSPA